jgi:hypothetical protein
MSILSKHTRTIAVHCVVALVVACSAVATASAQTRTKFISHISGVEGALFGCNADSYCLSLGSSPEGNGKVFINFNLFTPSGETISGFGDVAASAFVAPSKGSLSLSIDTTTVANFVTVICSDTGCDPFPGGLINFTWTVNATQTTSTSGTDNSLFPGFRRLTVGTSSSKSADVTGSALGIQFAPNDLQGNVLQLQNTNLTFFF